MKFIRGWQGCQSTSLQANKTRLPDAYQESYLLTERPGFWNQFEIV
jgi:hypothetical protein